jgi:hypothetical protein
MKFKHESEPAPHTIDHAPPLELLALDTLDVEILLLEEELLLSLV